MKILLLLIFSHNIIYDEMLEIQKLYIHNNKNIDVYFITLNETQSEEVILNNNIISINGKESYTNILFKTLKSLKFINNLNSQYDFVVRSNVSTIINLNNLYEYLKQLPKINVYTGAKVETLQWLLQPHEICDTKRDQSAYFGLKYIQGIGIILSYDIVQSILSFEHTIEYDIVDDVKLGLIIRDFFPEAYKNIDKLELPSLSYNYFKPESVFIRNKNVNRIDDIYNMYNIIDNFSDIKYQNFDKIIHISYKNIDHLENVKSEWLQLNPNYIVELYNDERCITFLNTYFGKKYGDIFNYIKDGPIKCDFFRLCVLFIFGGIYVDADIKPLIPLDEYIDDDVDLATCVSYNYKQHKNSFQFNPHFIVSKKYNNFIYDSIKKYECYYDNQITYSYWGWSICTMFKIETRFDLSDQKNIFNFIINNKKYQFITESVIIQEDKIINFKNYDELNEDRDSISCICCMYGDRIVINNFTNKQFLK
jgi:mannosyltransferase OCH1-like enzyme